MKKQDNTIIAPEEELCPPEETQYCVFCGGIQPIILPEFSEEEELNDEKPGLV